MTPLLGVVAGISYLLGALSMLLAVRYRERRRGRMPFNPQPGDSRITLFIRRHVVLMFIVCVLLDIVVTTVAVVVGIGFIILYHDVKDLQECQSNYLVRAAVLSTTRDDALQTILNDVADRAGEEAFYRDLAKEQVAYKALHDFRERAVGKDACT